MGPFSSLEGFYDYLFAPASAHTFESDAEYQKTLSRAKKLQNQQHRIVFTHGDFKAHNILVGDDGHLSGFLDWESAGWYPEYWEFTTAMRFGKDSWWFQVASWMGGRQYWDELGSDVALNLLTVDSYIAL
jgi:Ser/Thr protein kinase RdoA (MazF antagonist)